jgi:hypothetical protein
MEVFLLLKKTNLHLLSAWLTRPLRLQAAKASKSFLVLFFKKELLLFALPDLISELAP